MHHYYGIFKEIYESFGNIVKNIGIYESNFAGFYDSFSASEKEASLYLDEAARCGQRVLELCCGNGRLTTIFARNGFHITGVDASDDMLALLKKKKDEMPFGISKRMNLSKQDVYSMDLSGKFDFVFLPATTICILADDLLKTKQLFHKVADLLEDDGSFMFDIRLYDNVSFDKNEVSSVATGNKIVFYQEFIEKMERRAIGNFFMLEKQSESQMQMYLTYSNKRILSEEDVNHLIASTPFFIAEMEDDVEGDNTIRYYTLKKRK